MPFLIKSELALKKTFFIEQKLANLNYCAQTEILLKADMKSPGTIF